MEKNGLENNITTRKINGKRGRVAREEKKTIMDSLAGWDNRKSPTEWMRNIKDQIYGDELSSTEAGTAPDDDHFNVSKTHIFWHIT